MDKPKKNAPPGDPDGASSSHKSPAQRRDIDEARSR